MKKTSLADIANSLKVSKTLVSMVLNGKGDAMGISKDTQKKVLAKAKELNYRPNHFARGLRMGSSQTIGLIVSDVSNPFYASICKVIENEISKKGYNLIICSTDENIEREKEIVEMMLSKQVDGIIMSSSDHSGDNIRLISSRNCPLVLIDRKIENVKTHFVGVDNYKASKDATSMLFKKGFKNIAYFNISPSDVSSVKERLLGFHDVAAEHSLKEPVVFNIDFNEVDEQIEKALKECFEKDLHIDALFAVNNNVAIAILKGLKKMNKTVGEDLAFVAFDDIDLFSLSSPTISAIDQSLFDIASIAAELMIESIENPELVFQEKLLPTQIIERESLSA